MVNLNEITELLAELEEDNTIPKNVKQKLNAISIVLKGQTEMAIKIDMVLQELEEVTEDSNIQPHVRTQLWNIVSLLEKTDA